MESSDVASLLARVATIAEKDAEYRRNAGLDFNVFRLCGVHHYETRHSAILAALLDPTGTHGVAGTFLSMFLTRIGEAGLTISQATRIRTEVQIDADASSDSRLDILIEDPAQKWCVVIENKIYAAEGERQIGRYRKWLDRERSGWTRRILFLTLDGHPPETDSGADGSATILRLTAWSPGVLAWLRDCHREVVDKPYLRESIAQYINLVEQITGQSAMDAERTKEIIGLATKDVTAFCGYVELLRNKGAVFGKVAANIAEALHLQLDADFSKTWEWVSSSQVPFSSTDREPLIIIRHAERGFLVRISPERTSLRDVFVGIALEDAGTMIDSEAIREKLRGLPRWQSNQQWIGWSYLPDDIRSWDGDVLADFINGDKRRIVFRIWEILDNIGKAI